MAKSTLNFFSSWAYHSCFFWTSLLPCWFEKQAAVKYKSAYLWKHASCKLFPFSKLYCFGLDKKNSLSWNLRLNSWPLHYFVKLNQEKRWNICNCDCWDTKFVFCWIWWKTFSHELWGELGRTSSLQYLVPLWKWKWERWGKLQRQI